MPITKSFAGLSMLGLGMMPFGDFESIATITVGAGGASSIEFTSIPGTYQHLQVRWIARSTYASAEDTPLVQVNGDTASNYATHTLYGQGTAALTYGAASQTSIIAGRTAGNSETANVFGAGVIDFLDYTDTSKNTTVRCLSGMDGNGNGQVRVTSGLWSNTNAITSVKIIPSTGPNWVEHTTAALYGIRS